MILLQAEGGYLVSFSPNHGTRLFWQYSSTALQQHILDTVRLFNRGDLAKRIKSAEKAELKADIDECVETLTEERIFLSL